MKQITIITPVSLVATANAWMRACAYGPDDDKTFGEASHHDAEGREYSLAAGLLDEDVLDRLIEPPEEAPAWGADMAQARQAANNLVWHDTLPETGLTLDPDKITALEGFEMSAACDAMGLSRIVPPEPDPEPEE